METREQFLEGLLAINPRYDINLIGRAYDLAEKMHNGQLRKSGEFDYDEMELDVNMELAYETSSDSEITEDLKIFKEGYGFEYGDNEEFTFECDEDSYFEVNTNGQGKLLLSATSDFDSDVATIYPNANLDFFYGNGGTFNRLGTLYLHADPDSYLYQLRDDGRLVEVDAEYDEYDEYSEYEVTDEYGGSEAYEAYPDMREYEGEGEDAPDLSEE